MPLPYVTTSELGCRADDPNFDNAPLLQKGIDERGNVLLDQGGFLHTSLLTFPKGKSIKLAGSFSGYRWHTNGVTGLKPFSDTQPAILEVYGESPAGIGNIIENISFQGNSKVDGIRLLTGDTTLVQNCTFRSLDTAILLHSKGRLYSTTLLSNSINGCAVGIELIGGGSYCTTHVQGGSIISCGIGVSITNWTHTLLFQSVVIEAFTAIGMVLKDSVVKLDSCYLEGTNGLPCLWLKPGTSIAQVTGFSSMNTHRVQSGSRLHVEPTARTGYSVVV